MSSTSSEMTPTIAKPSQSDLVSANTAAPPILRLPKELLTMICASLDQQSAIRLRYVNPIFQDVTEVPIHRHVDLRLREKCWGLGVPTDVRVVDENISRWELCDSRALRVRRIAELALQNFCASGHRWDMLESVTLEPRQGSFISVLHFLSLSRSRLKTLRIDEKDRWLRLISREVKFFSKFKELAISGAPTFKSLTALHLDLNWDTCISRTLHLLSLAPALRTLSLQGGCDSFCDPLNDPNGKHIGCPDVDNSHNLPSGFPKGLETLECYTAIEESGDTDPKIVLRILEVNKIKTLRYKPLNLLDLNDGWMNPDAAIVIDDCQLNHLEYDPGSGSTLTLERRFEGTRFSVLTTLVLSERRLYCVAERRLEVGDCSV